MERWSHGACSYCCLDDVDGDGFITQEELGLRYDVFCRNEEDGNDIVNDSKI